MSQYLSFYLVEKKYLNNKVLCKNNDEEFSSSEFDHHSITLFYRSRNSELFRIWSKQYSIHGKFVVLTDEQLKTIFKILEEELGTAKKDYELYKLTSSNSNKDNEKIKLLEFLKKKSDQESNIVEKTMLNKLHDFISKNCIKEFNPEIYEEILHEYESTIEEYETTIHRIDTLLEFIEHRNDNDEFEYVWFME